MLEFLSTLVRHVSALVLELSSRDSQPEGDPHRQEDYPSRGTSRFSRSRVKNLLIHNLGEECHPVSPPVGTGLRDNYTCSVDYKQELYSIFWSGSMQYHDLVHSPNDPQYRFEKIQLSSEMVPDLVKVNSH